MGGRRSYRGDGTEEDKDALLRSPLDSRNVDSVKPAGDRLDDSGTMIAAEPTPPIHRVAGGNP